MSDRVVDIINALGTALIEDIGKKNDDSPEKIEGRVARLGSKMKTLKEVLNRSEQGGEGDM